MLMQLQQDLSLAYRALARRPAYTLSIVGTLVLGIGMLTALLSIVDGVLLQPLPYPEAQQLVAVWDRNVPRAKGENVVSVADWEVMRDRSKSLRALAAMVPDRQTLLGSQAQRVYGGLVSPDWFDVVRTRPRIGRPFTREEATTDAKVVVISDQLWRQRLNSNPAVIGTAMPFADGARTIIGVMPPAFEPPAFGWLESQQLYWVPFAGNEANRRYGRFLLLVGRLQPGVALASAEAELRAIRAQDAAETGSKAADDWTFDLQGLRAQMVGSVRTSILVLLGAATMLLVMVLVNVTSLVVVRTQSRRLEFALRSALGAEKGRILRQLGTEAFAIMMIAGPLAIVTAQVLLRGLLLVAPDNMPRLQHTHIGLTAILAAIVVEILALAVIAVVPATRVTAGRLASQLRSASLSVAGVRGHGFVPIAEIALAFVLSIGAGLALRTYVNLRSQDLGFDAERITTFRLSLPTDRYSEPAQRQSFFQTLTTELQQLPGTESVALASGSPFRFGGTVTTVSRPEVPLPTDQQPVAEFRTVTPEYFRTLSIPVVKGSLFAEVRVDAPRVVVISESMAKQLFADESPVGRDIVISNDPVTTVKVLGVVHDVRQLGPAQDATSTIYFPFSQSTSGTMDVLVRSTLAGEALVRQLSARVARIDASLPLEEVTKLPAAVEAKTAQQRMTVLLLSLFAVAALLVAAAGIYAVLVLRVHTQRRELGTRLSLGATPTGLRLTLLGDAGRHLLLGSLIGLASAVMLTRFMAALLFGVEALDVTTFAGVFGILGAVTLIAAWLPARSVTRVEPSVVLRES